MDPITSLLCALGAAMLLAGDQLVLQDPVPTLVLGVGLWAVLKRSGAPRALVLVAPCLWLLAHFWSVLPEKLSAYPFATDHPTLNAAPLWLAHFLYLAILLVSVAVARKVVGTGLAALSAGSSAMAMTFALLALLPKKDSSAATILDGCAEGWHDAAIATTALAWVVVALGSAALTTLPIPGDASPAAPSTAASAVVAAGATLLGAVITGVPFRGESDVSFFVYATLVLAWIAVAIGLALSARSGGGAPAWTGVALVGFQIFIGVPLALALADRLGGAASLGAALSSAGVVFGLLAIAIATVGSRFAKLRVVRQIAGVAILIPAYGSMHALMAALGEAFGMNHSRDPFATVDLIVRPTAYFGLAVYAAVHAYVAAPPIDGAASAELTARSA